MRSYHEGTWTDHTTDDDIDDTSGWRLDNGWSDPASFTVGDPDGVHVAVYDPREPGDPDDAGYLLVLSSPYTWDRVRAETLADVFDLIGRWASALDLAQEP